MMESGPKGLSRKIAVILEGLEDIRVSDAAAWKALSSELAGEERSVPAEPPIIRERLQVVIDGLNRLAAGGVAEPLAAVGALEESLLAVREALEGLTDGGAPALRLDDAAALLIGLEVQDAAGWQRLAAELGRIAQDDAARAEYRSHLEQAARLCQELAVGDAPNPESCAARVGQLIDQAMQDAAWAAEATDPPRREAPEAKTASPAKVDSDDYMPANADPDLLAEFITESTELIQNAEEALLSLEHDPEDMEAVGKVFRAFHTVKGTAGFLGLSLINELGHHAETLLSRVRDGEIRYSGGYADLSLQALDVIKQLVSAVQQALAGAPLDKPQGYDELLKVLKNPEAAGVGEEPSEIPAPRVGDILVAQGKLGREEVEQALEAHPGDKTGVALVKSATARLPDVGQALRVQKQMRSGSAAMDSSVRVSTQRLDRLIDMVGELVIAHSMVAQDRLLVNSENYGLAKKVAHTNKIVRELQDISLSMRMVPVKSTFSKMARLARDVSRKLGKNVLFITEGEDTEIDRNLVDIINDPLVHMVRNAVDHGIESPEQRRAAGKPEQGTVKIAAYHSAGSIVVEISDDGKGLDREVLLVKARERGLIAENAELSDREVHHLIFEPGFSTATVVTDVSGRGVGMDVVRKNIELLRGTVEIKSEKGKGSVFRMSLPLTLAIIDGMVIRVGTETYVIPTVSIIRSVKPSQAELSTVFGQGEMLQLQDKLMPLYRVDRIYNIQGGKEDLKEAIVVVVEDGDRKAGLVVDELVGRQQVVIKSLGQTMKNIPGISGGAIMPDGRVGLILDVGGLLRFATPERREGCREDGAGAKLLALAA